MKKQNYGFTLIELMVAVFISSIVVIAAYTLMTGSTDAFHDQDDRRLLEGNVRNAELLIQRDLSRTGYHAPFEKNNVAVGEVIDVHQVYVCQNSNAGTLHNAFEFYSYGDKLGSDKRNQYTTFTILADLTDYEGLAITADAGTPAADKLTLANAISLPLSASAFTDFPNAPSSSYTAPAHEVTDAQSYESIFNRIFRYARAAYVISSSSLSFITPITSASYDATNKVGEVNVSLCSGYSNFGFTGDGMNKFADAKLYPVVSVTYTVAPCTKTAGETSQCLVRCYGNPFAADYSHLLDNPPAIAGTGNESNCQVLLKNVVKFIVVPLSENIPIYNATTASRNFENIPLKDVKSFYFEIQSYSNRITPNVSGTAGSVDASFYYDADGKGHALAMARGTSILKTPNLAVDNTVLTGNDDLASVQVNKVVVEPETGSTP